MEIVRILTTLGVLAAFVGILWWAYAPIRKSRFEDDARLPFEGDEG